MIQGQWDLYYFPGIKIKLLDDSGTMGFILTFQAGIKIKLLDDSGTMRFILTFQV